MSNKIGVANKTKKNVFLILILGNLLKKKNMAKKISASNNKEDFKTKGSPLGDNNKCKISGKFKLKPIDINSANWRPSDIINTTNNISLIILEFDLKEKNADAHSTSKLNNGR